MRILLVVFALALTAPTAGRTGPSLLPLGKWIVGNQDQSCTLGRSFGQVEQPVDLSIDVTGWGAGKVGLALDQMRAVTAAASAADLVEVTGLHRTVQLQTGPMKAAFDALGLCRRLLIQNWQVDPATLVDASKLDGSWFLDPAFQAATHKPHTGAQIVAALAIESDGIPSGCRTIVSTNNAALGAAACAVLIRKVRFGPALGHRSSIVAFLWTTRLA